MRIKRISSYSKKGKGWATLEITPRCNFNCRFCYISYGNSRIDELNTREIFHLVNEISKFGCIGVIISGGEPFIREDFIDIYRYIIRKGLFVEIITNGSLLNRNIIREIKRYPFYLIHVSVYGASAESYKNITGIKSGYQKVMQNLDLLKKERANFYITSIITKLNKKDLPRIKKIADILGVKFIASPSIGPRINKDTTPYSLKYGRKKRKLRCSGYIFIDYQGILRICPFVRDHLSFDLKKISLKEAWEKRLKQKIEVDCPLI